MKSSFDDEEEVKRLLAFCNTKRFTISELAIAVNAETLSRHIVESSDIADVRNLLQGYRACIVEIAARSLEDANFPNAGDLLRAGFVAIVIDEDVTANRRANMKGSN